MENNQEKDANWKKITAGLFPPYQHPHPEAFVTRVMARIENEPVSNRFGLSWKIPVLSLAGLVALGFIFIQPMNATISTEDLLLADDAEMTNLHLAFQSEEPQPDQLLAISMEE